MLAQSLPDMSAKRRRDAFGMEDSHRTVSRTIEMNDDVFDHVEQSVVKVAVEVGLG
jgi:hypothetical protein